MHNERVQPRRYSRGSDRSIKFVLFVSIHIFVSICIFVFFALFIKRTHTTKLIKALAFYIKIILYPEY